MISRKKIQSGFTLVEMAVVLLIIGILITPAISAYNLHIIKKKAERSEVAMTNAMSQVNDFLNYYGRYPCPAPMNAAPGDDGYGREDCAATGMPEISVETSGRTDITLADPAILVGSLPFKTLNLDEADSVDGYKGRLTYAVTRALTNADTYSSELGGITLLSRDAAGTGVSAVEIPDSVHFLVISHGAENGGAIDEMGNIIGGGCSGSVDETENCDYLDVTSDPVFVTHQKMADFDDDVRYAIGRAVTPWIYQTGSNTNIHLRRADTVVVGQSGLTTAVPGDFDNLMDMHMHVRYADVSQTESSGVLNVAVGNPGTRGTIAVNNICAEATTFTANPPPASDLDGRCTRPLLISGYDPASYDPANHSASMPVNTADAGFFDAANRFGVDVSSFINAAGTTEGIHTYSGLVNSSTGGMACGDGSVMVGIQDNRPICSRYIQFNCPDGQTVMDVNAAGEIVCGDTTGPWCDSMTVTDMCGGTQTVPATISGSHGRVYSGVCYVFNPAGTPTWWVPPNAPSEINALVVPGDAAATFAAIQAYLDVYNNGPRREVACNSARDQQDDSALVRENYYCDGDGEWVSPDETGRRVERGWWNANLRGDTYAPAAGAQPSGINHPSYQPFDASNPMSVPPADSNHDCWCSESYVADLEPCWNGGVGQVVSIRKRPCPRTEHYTIDLWNSYDDSGYGDTFCTCVEALNQQTGWETCSSYYSVHHQGMSGDVLTYTDRTCNPTQTTERVDASACLCPDRDDQIPDPTPVACPDGTTNSFTFEGQDYTNVASVTHRRWVCPGPNGDNGPVNSAAEAGRYVETTHTQACVCDGSARGTRVRSCSSVDPAMGGPGLTVETRMNCATGELEDTGVVLGGSCYTCTWQAPTSGGHNGNRTYSEGPISGAQACNCNTDTSSSRTCSRPGGLGYFIYNNCTCRPN